MFRAGVRSPDLRTLGNYLVGVVETELRAENLPSDTFTDLQADSLRLAKTASRSTLGFMTEMAFEPGWIIADMGGLRRCDVNVLNHGLRRMLWNRGDYVRPSNSSTNASTPAPERPRINRGRTDNPPGRLAPATARQFVNPTRTYSPVMRTADLPDLQIPWWHGRPLRYQFA